MVMPEKTTLHSNTTNLGFSSIEEIIADIAAGKMVIMVDDENRENEGDLLMAAENPRADFASHLNYPDRLDLGLAFGDACVPIEGYPIPLFPPSGIVKAAAYECLNLEVLHLLGK